MKAILQAKKPKPRASRRRMLVRRSTQSNPDIRSSSAPDDADDESQSEDTDDDDPVSAALAKDLEKLKGLLPTLRRRQESAKAVAREVWSTASTLTVLT